MNLAAFSNGLSNGLSFRTNRYRELRTGPQLSPIPDEFQALEFCPHARPVSSKKTLDPVAAIFQPGSSEHKSPHVPPASGSPLDKLPRELRDKIYKNLLVFERPLRRVEWQDSRRRWHNHHRNCCPRNPYLCRFGPWIMTCRNPWRNGVCDDMNILLVNRKIHEEARAILYKKNLFGTEHHNLPYIMQNADLLSKVRRVEIDAQLSINWGISDEEFAQCLKRLDQAPKVKWVLVYCGCWSRKSGNSHDPFTWCKQNGLGELVSFEMGRQRLENHPKIEFRHSVLAEVWPRVLALYAKGVRSGRDVSIDGKPVGDVVATWLYFYILGDRVFRSFRIWRTLEDQNRFPLSAFTSLTDDISGDAGLLRHFTLWFSDVVSSLLYMGFRFSVMGFHDATLKPLDLDAVERIERR